MVINDIYTAVQTAIGGVTSVANFSLWNNQLVNEPEEYAFNFPAIFLEFTQLDWVATSLQIADNTGVFVTAEQKGEIEITLHCTFSTLYAEDGAFLLKVLPVLDSIYRAVNELAGTNFSPLLRVRERQDADHDNVIDWQMVFSTTAYECGVDPSTKQQVENVTLSLSTDLIVMNNILNVGILNSPLAAVITNVAFTSPLYAGDSQAITFDIKLTGNEGVNTYTVACKFGSITKTQNVAFDGETLQSLSFTFSVNTLLQGDTGIVISCLTTSETDTASVKNYAYFETQGAPFNSQSLGYNLVKIDNLLFCGLVNTNYIMSIDLTDYTQKKYIGGDAQYSYSILTDGVNVYYLAHNGTARANKFDKNLTALTGLTLPYGSRSSGIVHNGYIYGHNDSSAFFRIDTSDFATVQGFAYAFLGCSYFFTNCASGNYVYFNNWANLSLTATVYGYIYRIDTTNFASGGVLLRDISTANANFKGAKGICTDDSYIYAITHASLAAPYTINIVKLDLAQFPESGATGITSRDITTDDSNTSSDAAYITVDANYLYIVRENNTKVYRYSKSTLQIVDSYDTANDLAEIGIFRQPFVDNGNVYIGTTDIPTATQRTLRVAINSNFA